MATTFCAALTCSNDIPVIEDADCARPALLMPVPRQEAFRMGIATAGALLYTFAHGGQTPQRTFTNGSLTVPNAFPLVADSTGLFGPIYPSPGVDYDFALRSADGVLLWFQPDVTSGPEVACIDASPDVIQQEAFLP